MKVYPLHQIDFYKSDHRSQYPVGTELVHSNFTPRSDKHAPRVPGVDNRIIVAGTQYFIMWMLQDVWVNGFFRQPKEQVVARYARRLNNALGASKQITLEHIEKLHDLGYLPLSIRALEEGEAVRAGVPTVFVETTILNQDFAWLTNYFETIFSNMNWKPSTSATTAYKYKQLLMRYAMETGCDLMNVQFQAHDFSMRGMNGPHDAAMSGIGHLFSFWGTDSIPAIDLLEDYYGADSDKEPVGMSVAATEHSVMCMGGCKTGEEFNTFKRLITEVYPNGFVSIVSDTWDYWQVLTDYLPRLKESILARKGGKFGDRVVIRPDSGDPVKIVIGDPDAVPGTPQYKGSIEVLWETFGGTITPNGYKLLDPHIGLIYGDGITLDRAYRILEGLKQKGFASTNVVFGVGSYTYTYTTRDTYGYAIKATAGQIKGQEVQIFKDPKTDGKVGGMKKSAKGYVAVYRDETGEWVAKDGFSRSQWLEKNEMKEIFRDGVLLLPTTLNEIRIRIEKNVFRALKDPTLAA